MFNLLMDIIPSRSFNLLYVILDSIFVIFFLILLILKKRYVTVIWAIFGGILYFIVDYFGFHLIAHSRVITFDGRQSELITCLVLIWMSLSYGITNFAFIWLCLKKDKYLKLWLFLIIFWWLVAPTLSEAYPYYIITTSRTVSKYHFIMGFILVFGYAACVIYNLFSKKKNIPILRLNLIGISVQFAWEFSLLINGIRPMNEASIKTLILNSLIETNLGMPYIYLIYIFVSSRVNGDLKKVENEIEDTK